MDDNLEQAKKKTDECQMALNNELDSYTLSRFQPSASRLSGQFLATNRKAFHHKRMRQIVNECFNKEEEGDEPTVPLSQQAAFPSQTPGLTLAEYRNSRYYRELLKKTEDCKADLIEVLETYIKSCFPSSATGRNAQFFANLQSLHREQMLLLIDDYFNSEDNDLPIFSTTVHSVNQLDVTSNEEAASDQVDTTPSISPVTPSDQQQLVNRGEAQVKEKPIEDVLSSLLNHQERDQVEEESVVQKPSDAQQQVPVPTAVNANAEQVDNSVNNNFENLNESQVVYFSDDLVVDEQAIFEVSFVDVTFPAVNFVTLPSTENVNYAIVPEVNSAVEYSTVNRNRKRTIPLDSGELSTHKRVAVEPVVATDNDVEEDEVDDEEEEVGVEGESVRLSVIVHHLNCPEADCTEECKDKAQLNGHLLNKHQIMAYRCKVKDCGLSFTTPNELSDHHKLAHRNLKDLPCAQCETISKGFKKLYNHFRRCHEEGEFRCSADKCDFTGKTRSEVYGHQYKHQLRKFNCTFVNCTASFKHKSNLTIHLRTHTHERPFVCEGCPKAFTRIDHLIKHQRIHSGLKPYICTWPGCDYSASDRTSVNGHVRVHHFNLPATKKEQAKRGIIDTRDARKFFEKIPIN